MTTSNGAGLEPGGTFLAGLVEEAEYARVRRVSVRTCQRDRHLRISPPYIKLGRRVYYRAEAIQAWLLSNETTTVEHGMRGGSSLARRKLGGRS
jgi:hypothetical protein